VEDEGLSTLSDDILFCFRVIVLVQVLRLKNITVSLINRSGELVANDELLIV
jgi:hypothetical protein